MNKLKKLYDITKVLKNEEIFAGTAQLAIYKNDIELFYGNNEFVKNRVEHSMSSNYLVKMDCDMGTFCHNGNVSFTRKNDSTIKHPHFHGGHGHHKHMWTTLMTFFKLLNEVEAVELEEGKSQLTYSVNDIPKEWVEKIRNAHSSTEFKAHHNHKHMEILKEIEPTSIDIVITISSTNKIEKIEGEFTAIHKDAPLKGEGYIILK